MADKHYTGNWESIQTHRVPKWYDDAKFGIFIHWGLYSVPAYAPHTWELGDAGVTDWFCNNPYAEWYYNSVNVGRGPGYEHHVKKYGADFKYEDFIPMWKAENWDPASWAQIFKNAGAQYVVLTTKHHDGFCLFPSEYTDFNSVKMGPQRDITGELTDAVRDAGIRMGLYYSGLIDWQYANDPIYEDEDLFGTACPTYEYADFSYKQMKELIDKYEPSVLWNDIGWPKQSEDAMPYLFAHYYNKVRDGVVNDRFNGKYYDFLTKEYQAGEMDRNQKWEMCRGMGLSFGYNEIESDSLLISVPELISLLVSTTANNGNLLLNIGPKADGTIPAEQVRRLEILGKWLAVNGEGIYGTRLSDRETEAYENGLRLYFTRKDHVLYVFADGLKEGINEFCITGFTGTLRPLDDRLQIETLPAEEGLIVRTLNYEAGMYTIGLTSEA